ncbi:Ankyrin-1 [Trichoderma lentiforme]|uniref:Ankyrin-1 n=1 Tax=Trichoderma lentiforme TaxID=1567552 RepID=A0A9P4XS18_9HYPO|nr:Ankyrin-1 [Trichoderma lentiforme]
MSDPNNYAVGWICAITTEYVAAQSFLDEKHQGPERVSPNDNNDYTLGKIGKHHVVIAVLPDGEYGISSAASVARDMLHSFPNIRIGLMVGIGGGAPSKKHDIRLGDIVVSSSGNGKGGVFQYDFGKTVQEQSFQHSGFLNQPPTVLRTAVSGLRSHYELEGHQLDLNISKILEKWKRLKRKYSRPPLNTDLLYRTDIIHPLGDETSCAVLCGDSPLKLILRPERTEDDDIPTIHYGLIASANQLIKDASIRDTLAAEKDILCFEMEAAGLMNHFPCLVIRGICDYSDSHKNKAWQGYAAMAAAAYAKDLLDRIAPNKIEAEKRVGEILSDVKERIIDMSQNITKIVRKQLDQELQAILDWITPIDYASQQNDLIKSRQPGTGEWLVSSEEFQNWINQKKQTLFCPGIPGAGKMIATSIAVSYLHAKFQEKHDIGIAYLYLNFRRQSEQEPKHILSSILRQLSQMGSKAHDSVQELYKKHKPKKEEDQPTSQIPPTPPSLDEIVKTLDQIIASYSRTYIIIDALDECTDSNLHRSTLMFEIFGLQTRLGANLFFTSRLVPHIEKDFESRDCSTLEIRATDKDIRQYLDSNMSQLPAFIFQSTGLEERIKSSIIEASKEVFLLARLHLDSLRDKISVWQVEYALKKLPKGLDAYEQAYKGAMERIKSQKRGFCDLANRVLFWITCSRRPLSTSELQHALAVVNDSSSLNPRNLPEIGLMVSVCGGLVAVDEHSDIIRLVHYTVQEYFERTCDTWFPTAQADIAKTCITYLSFDIFKAGANSTDEASEAGLQSNILYDYAACNWGHHVRISLDPDVNLLAVAFLESEARASTWRQAMQIYRRRSRYYCPEDHDIGGLHMAAYFGLLGPMKALLKKHDPDSVAEGWTPIHWASLEGHEAVVKLLLENDANPDGWDRECSPLKLAVQNDHTAVVRLLLEGAANPGDRDLDDYLEHASKTGNIDMAKLLFRWRGHQPNDRYLLHIAARSGHETMITLLLDEGFDLESQDKEGKTPLQHAAANGHEAVVRQLLQKGANPESKDVEGQTPLLEAAENGHDAVVQLLLQKGANLDIKDKWGRTPLVAAMEHNHEAAAKLLLGNGADLEAKASSLDGLLVIAAEQGHYQIVELLLESGVNPNRKPGANSTALYSAAEEGHIEIVRLLLNKGADPGYILEGQLGHETALDRAAEVGHGAVMRLLLENGATLGDKDDWREALDSAAKYGCKSVVELLVESGISPNFKCDDGSQGIPLLSAARRGHEETVKFLLECGADPNAHDADGTTPLAQAAGNGYEAMVKLLLEHGADPDAGRVKELRPLAAAAEKGHEEIVRLLLEGGAKLERGKGGGRRHKDALFLASRSQNDAAVKLLLDKGAELESQHNNGWFTRTPLHYAAHIGYEAMVHQFLKKGANFDARDKDGRTPLHYAIEKGHEGVVKLLLDAGANPNRATTTTEREPPIYLAAEKGHAAMVELLLDKGASPDSGSLISTPLSISIENGHEAVVKLLLDRGSDPNRSAGHMDGSPLCIAAKYGRAHIAKLLLDKGANPTHTLHSLYRKPQQPIHLAASSGCEAIVLLLLDKGVSPDVVCGGFDGDETPLHKAVNEGHEAVVRLLLRKGADPNSKNDKQQTPLDYAIQRGIVGSENDAVIKLLLQSRADLNIEEETLFEFLKPRRSDLINLFLKRGVSTESTDDEGSTLLQYSVQWDYTSIIRVLLAHNASTEVKDSRGETPLHMAASRGRKVAAKLLLDKGANIKSKDNNGDTPLHQAAGNGSEIVVKLLLDRGADVEAKNMAGKTPLHYAVSAGSGRVVQLLLTRGANAHIKDKKGRTPLRNAKSDGQEEIVGLLLGRHGN